MTKERDHFFDTAEVSLPLILSPSQTASAMEACVLAPSFRGLSGRPSRSPEHTALLTETIASSLVGLPLSLGGVPCSDAVPSCHVSGTEIQHTA